MASRECHAPSLCAVLNLLRKLHNFTSQASSKIPLNVFHALPFFQNKNTMLTSGLETTKHIEGASQVQVTRRLRPPASKDCFYDDPT